MNNKIIGLFMAVGTAAITWAGVIGGLILFRDFPGVDAIGMGFMMLVGFIIGGVVSQRVVEAVSDSDFFS